MAESTSHPPFDRPALAVAAALALAGAAAIWLPRFLPMADLPEHRAVAAALAGLSEDAPAPEWTRFWRLRSSGGYGATWYEAAAAFHAPETVARAELTIALVAWISGILLLSRRIGSSQRIAALAAPLAFGLAYHWGFLPYVLAMPLVPWTCWAAAGSLDADASPARRTARLVLIAVLLMLAALTHLAVAGIALLAAVLVLAPATPDRRRVLSWFATGLALAIPVVLVAYFQIASGRPNVPEPPLPVSWPDAGDRIVSLITWLAPGPIPTLGIGFIALAAAVAVVRCRGAAFPPATGVRRRLAVLCGLLALGSIFLPRHAADVHFLAERLVPVAAGVALALPGASGTGRRPSGLWLAAAIAALAVLVMETAASLQYADEVGNLETITAMIPRGSRILAIPADPASDAFPSDVPVHAHVASFVVQRRGGVVSIPPLANVGMPVELTAEGLRALAVPARGDNRGDRLRARIDDWDFVLVYARGGFPKRALADLGDVLSPVLPPGTPPDRPYAGPWYLLTVRGSPGSGGGRSSLRR